MAFIAMMIASISLFLFMLGIGGIILSIVFRFINSRWAKKRNKKSRVLSVFGIISFVLGFLSALPLLLIIGFNITSDIKQSISQRNSIEYNVYADNIDRAKTLLEKGADPNKQKEYIYPPIYYAVKNDNYDMAKMLLDYGADPNAEATWSTQLFYFVIQNNDFKYVKLFVEYNADVNDVKFEQTPLDKAYFTNNDEIINYLIANGAKTYEEIKGE